MLRACAVRRRYRALDKSAAKHARLALAMLVEDAGLPRRDAILAVDQLDLIAGASGAQPSRPRRPRRAHLDENFAADGIVDIGIADPVDVAQHNVARTQSLARAHHHAAALGVEPHDIERRAGRQAEPFALADGEMNDAGMPAEYLAVAVDDI